METGSRERSDRRQSGGSIWSGLKQMFNNKPSPQTGPQSGAAQKKLQHSAYSYSCLGSSSRRTDEDMYEGPKGSQALSRNISYSHESVFQMDPYVVQPASNSSPKLRSTSSSVALPGLVQAELLSVLAERHYGGTQPGPGRRHKKTARGKAGSEGCVWEEEDLGLPASLGESPGDLTRSTSRHHSSCSDNSLLSLDRIISDTGEAMDRDSGAESLASLGQGQEPVSSGVLSHSAARHKMAIRPKRNHVVRRHRQLHQLTEEPERQNNFPIGQSDSDEKSVPGNVRNRSKSLDKMFQGYNSASVRTNKVQETVRDDVQKKSKQKDQDGNFLSRLFGSKRLRLRTSVSKKDLTTEKRSSAVTNPDRLPSPASPESQETHFFPNPDVNPEQFSPTRSKQNYKQKPPPPPPPDSQPPLPLPEPSQSPPPVPSRHPHYNPAGFEMSTSPEIGVPVLPPLPSNKSDIILKKSPAASSGQFTSSSQHSFHNSVQNWSYANEGRIRSMVSLSPGAAGVTESRESLATISSLMMDTDQEPDLLDQTDFQDSTQKEEEEEKPEPDEIVPYGSVRDLAEHSGSGLKYENNESEYAELRLRKENTDLFRRKSLNKTIDQLQDNDLITEVNGTGQESQSLDQIDKKSDVIDVDEENCDDDNQRDFNSHISPNTESPTDPGQAVGGEAPTDPAIREEHTRVESGILPDERKSYEDKKLETLMDTSNQEDEICQFAMSPDDVNIREKVVSTSTLPRFHNSVQKSQTEKLPKGEPSKRESPVITANPNDRVVKDDQKYNNGPKKPEISPKPVPAPRTFFLRPKPDFSKQLNPVNELTNLRLSRRSIIADEDSTGVTNVTENKSPEQNDGEISVKERAKSFSDLPPSYNFGPKPFRPSLSPGEVGKAKPKIANKPIPAPRQFRNEPVPEPIFVLKKNDETQKSSDDLREKLEDNLSVPVNSRNIDQDEYHLEDIQVKKIADKFQKNVPPKPARKSSPSKKEEDNNAKSSVLNIVTKINSMTVL